MAVPVTLRETLIDHLRQSIPGLLAVYGFGSRITTEARPDSYLDMAILRDGMLDPVHGFELAGELADLCGWPVDLVDLRTASTVMQYQILTRCQRWWAADHRAGCYEATLLNLKTQLDEARSALLDDIVREGKVHG